MTNFQYCGQTDTYQYRVVEDDGTVVRDWTPITLAEAGEIIQHSLATTRQLWRADREWPHALRDRPVRAMMEAQCPF